MKKLFTLVLAAVMMLSVVFIGASASNGGPFVAAAQTGQVTVKKRKKGAVRRGYAGGKWVVRKTWDGTKWVSKRVWVGTKYVGKKSWKTGRKVVSRTKKVVY
ncbi:MAG: hypothetical protein ACK4S4_09790 [Pyrinomonadaceae bacterium]